MPKEDSEKKETEAGAMDDNAMERVKKRNQKTRNTLQELFDDNNTGRYGKGTDN